ncbi:MAG: T9SS type A sorting domain-containing protein, partial [Bacteroidota bacterium]
NVMFVGSDGGLNYTTNAGSFQPFFGTRNLGYNVTQFYSCDVRDYSGIFVGGTQDNGNYLVDFTGNTTKTGVEIKGGDGGDVQVSKSNPNAIFAEYVNGSVVRSSNNGQSFNYFFDTYIDADPSTSAQYGYPDDGAAFIAPILLWENVSADSNLNEYSKFYIGTGSGVWMTKQGLNFSVTPKWFKVGVTSGVVISMAVTPDGKTLFAGTENGNLYRIDGLDTTYVRDTTGAFSPADVGITTTLIHQFGRFVTGVTVDKSDANHLVVTLGNYGNTDYVYESTDALSAAAFSNITGSGLPKMPVYCSAIDPTNPNTIIIGTELGIWATENGGANWAEQNNSMARVPVTKLRQGPVGNFQNVLYAATYGNGVLRTFGNAVLSTHEPEAKSTAIKVFPNPASDDLNFIAQFSLGNTEIIANLIDMSGRIVKSENYGKHSLGVYTFKINVADVNTGNYLLQVIQEGKQSVSKVVVLR